MIGYITLIFIFSLYHESDAVINCSDPNFQETLIGMKSFIDYQGYLYNIAFEFDSIALDFFSGFKVIGQLPLYINAFNTVIESAENKDNEITEYVSLFRTMLSNVLKSNCQWLNNHGPTFSSRPVNCSDPGEIALLASYMGTFTLAQHMMGVIGNNYCNTIVKPISVEEYLNTTLPADDLATKTKLKALHDSYMK